MKEGITPFFKGFKQVGLLNWFIYHVCTLFELAWMYCPFRFRTSTLPLFFRPGQPFITAIFSLVSSIMFFVFITIFLLRFLLYDELIWEIFILLCFWFFFSLMFRSIQSAMNTYITFNGKALKVIRHGLFKKQVLIFPKEDLKGLLLLSESYYTTPNHKVCVVTKDGRKILIYLSTSQGRSVRKIQMWNKLFQLPLLEKEDPSSPINNLNLKRGSYIASSVEH